jgi:hypothetical protein
MIEYACSFEKRAVQENVAADTYGVGHAAMAQYLQLIFTRVTRVALEEGRVY